MDKPTLIKNINKVLEAKWSRQQLAHGKWIEVNWDWVGLIGKIVPLYKSRGWKIIKHVELSTKGRRVFLAFINPGKAKRLRTPRNVIGII